ncbi:SaV-like [uncultured Caudovirales phage]|uniref:SaV-like n=1 Tax=uncultured Caudovirales phage TaxID=2100421 RepID=A0A6J5M9H9_9CAUD|nr:SaV-like [uncultured Caudovirales phage]
MRKDCPKCGTPMCITSSDGNFIYNCFEKNCLFEYVEKKLDLINHPSHYTQGGIETIDYLQAKMTQEQFEGYLVGNILKYVSRYPHKNGIEDLRKAQWYVNKLIEVTKNE